MFWGVCCSNGDQVYFQLLQAENWRIKNYLTSYVKTKRYVTPLACLYFHNKMIPVVILIGQICCSKNKKTGFEVLQYLKQWMDIEVYSVICNVWH